jgi:hypothetical protein
MPIKTDPILKNTLISVLSFLKHKANDKGIKPVISVTKLIDLLKTSGMTLTYQQLVDLTKDPTIAKSIKSINKSQVTIALGDEEPEEAPLEDLDNTEPSFEDNEGEDEEFNPDDFQAPDEEGFEEDFSNENNNSPEESEEHNSRYGSEKSTVSCMAKRALSRAD